MASPALVGSHGVTTADFGVVDQLHDQIRFARGIELAIVGAAQLHDFDPSPIQSLCTLHEERLRAISVAIAAKLGVRVRS